MLRGRLTVSISNFKKICDYYDTLAKDRTLGVRDFRRSINIGVKAFRQARLDWQRDRAACKSQDSKADRIRAIMEKSLGNKADNVVIVTEHHHIPTNSKDPTDDEMKAEVVRGLFAEAKSGNHQAAFRLSQIKGWIIDKQEIIIGQLTADDYARRNIEADRQLAERGHRVAEVQTVPPLLLGEIREGEGQVTRGNPVCDTATHRESADRPTDVSA